LPEYKFNKDQQQHILHRMTEIEGRWNEHQFIKIWRKASMEKLAINCRPVMRSADFSLRRRACGSTES
jgi:hypothetical protein